jgi:hypothetical protein
MRLAKEMGLPITSRVRLRKKSIASMTLISGPHVHKKSRDQYHIINHSAFFTIIIQTKRQQAIFLEYKALLLEEPLGAREGEKHKTAFPRAPKNSGDRRQNEGIQYSFSCRGFAGQDRASSIPQLSIPRT